MMLRKRKMRLMLSQRLGKKTKSKMEATRSRPDPKSIPWRRWTGANKVGAATTPPSASKTN